MPKAHRVNFDDIKAQADFRLVLAHYGLHPRGQGEQAKVRCPFHDDQHASCSVNLTKGVWHCFACHAKGNVLEFVHRLEAERAQGSTVSLRDAGYKLAAICGVNLDHQHASHSRQEGHRATKRAKTVSAPSDSPNRAESVPERQEEASGEATRPTRNRPLGFALTLDAQHPYVAQRGISPELAATFGLGVSDQGSMVGRLCIPIHNAQAELVGYVGRFVGDVPQGEEKYRLPKGFHKSLELFNVHRVAHCRHLVVVEGFFDAIRLHGLRLPAVSPMGTSMSAEQIALLREHCRALKAVTVMLDGDEAGRTASPAIAAALAAHFWVRIAQLPDGSEPDTLEETQLRQLLRPGT
jgi:DNA primase